MACSYPITAYRAKVPNANGKRPVVFNTVDGYADRPLLIPCQQCIRCRLTKARQWAIRCVHEASLHTHNAYLTLTYDDHTLPQRGELRKEDFQKFMKRLRKQYDEKLRYFHCGEYGDENFRPHYHAIIFNLRIDDLVQTGYSKGYPIYQSATITEIWKKGLVFIGEVNYQTAGYVARYAMKKVRHNKSQEIYFTDEDGTNYTKEEFNRYSRVDPITGEVYCVPKEYVTMSRGRRPDGGIGYRWYKKYKDETYRDDYLVNEGMQVQVPKYYDDIYKMDSLAFDSLGNEISDLDDTKAKRRAKAAQNAEDNTPGRLLAKEKCAEAKLKLKERSL